MRVQGAEGFWNPDGVTAQPGKFQEDGRHLPPAAEWPPHFAMVEFAQGVWRSLVQMTGSGILWDDDSGSNL